MLIIQDEQIQGNFAAVIGQSIFLFPASTLGLGQWSRTQKYRKYQVRNGTSCFLKTQLSNSQEAINTNKNSHSSHIIKGGKSHL